ncbi:MAG TPA: hypothetical protein VEC36_08700, partial [Patescibacteria group bacterium]|nr:hypothetical protein [Patescibacteria group bacterium]
MAVFSAGAYAQSGQFLGFQYSQRITVADSVLKTGAQFIHAPTVLIQLDSSYTLQTPLDYTLDARTGIIKFSEHFLKIFSQRDSAFIKISADYTPAPSITSFRKREPIFKMAFSDTTFLRRDTPVRSMDFSFKKDDFQRSGSIVRGFSIGSNRDLGLTSGLRLQFSGNVGTGMELRGVLSDDNIPIQPEGTTQTLQEFDKVFIEMQSRHISTTLGDFNLNVRGGEFASFQRKLQGITGKAGYSGGEAEVSAALTRGRFSTMEFAGIEGVQGPYRLRGKNGERDIIAIAGTERIFV